MKYTAFIIERRLSLFHIEDKEKGVPTCPLRECTLGQWGGAGTHSVGSFHPNPRTSRLDTAAVWLPHTAWGTLAMRPFSRWPREGCRPFTPRRGTGVHSVPTYVHIQTFKILYNNVLGVLRAIPYCKNWCAGCFWMSMRRD